jgi:hypothetical protein
MNSQAALAAALSRKDVGNQMFRSNDFEGGAAQYCVCVSECDSALKTCDKAEREAWRALLVTACSNTAAACVRFGASAKAGEFGSIALEVDRSHAEALARLTEACEVDEEWTRDVVHPYIKEGERAERFFAEGKCRKGLAAAREAAAVARRGRDHVYHALALSMIMDETEDAWARTGGEEVTVEEVIQAALAVLDLCWPLVGKPDYLLTNTGTGAMPRVQIDTIEATAWLVLARLDFDYPSDLAACRENCMSTLSPCLRAWRRCSPPGRGSLPIAWPTTASAPMSSLRAR